MMLVDSSTRPPSVTITNTYALISPASMPWSSAAAALMASYSLTALRLSTGAASSSGGNRRDAQLDGHRGDQVHEPAQEQVPLFVDVPLIALLSRQDQHFLALREVIRCGHDCTPLASSTSTASSAARASRSVLSSPSGVSSPGPAAGAVASVSGLPFSASPACPFLSAATNRRSTSYNRFAPTP